MRRNLTIFLLLLSCSLFANVIRVGKDQRIASLRQAVSMAQAGDTILLQGGRYKERNIIINKSIVLLGKDNPVLDGEAKYEILTISGNNITVKGITFENSGYSSMNDYASISLIDAQNVRIEANTIRNAYFAIHVANVSHSFIQNNIISGLTRSEQTSGNGIHLWKCDNMLVEGNDIEKHRDGIYFEFVTNSIIQRNISHDNIRYGLHFMFSNNDGYIENTFRGNGAGVAVMYSHHVLMLNNLFDHNWGDNAYGLLLKEISDGKILGNKFENNTVGIQMESTNRIQVAKNDFGNNGYAIRMAASCNENKLEYNAFVSNTFDVATNGSVMLSELRHNYWDKYEGYDMNRDGIGDVPYHPVSMYSMVIEQNPTASILMHSFMVMLLDKAEKAIPSLTPENMVDQTPIMKRSLL